MTRKSFDLALLSEIKHISRKFYSAGKPYLPYRAGSDLVPEFLAVADNRWQVRMNASTHDRRGILQHSGDEALNNTRRLEEKPVRHLPGYTYYELDEQEGAETLIVSFGISAAAAREAIDDIRESGRKVSLLIPKTILPVPDIYYEITGRYKRVIFAEENINAQYARIMFGEKLPEKIRPVGSLGSMIGSEDLIKEEARL